MKNHSGFLSAGNTSHGATGESNSSGRRPRLVSASLSGMLLLLSACGGGSGSSSSGADGGADTKVASDATPVSGIFVDSWVEGLNYQTPSQSGVTDARGAFLYVPGEKVTFRVGSIVLGNAPGADLITPLDLVVGAVDETDARVTNILRFLQTLDEDRNPDNGIRISAVTRDSLAGVSLNMDATETEFETAFSLLSNASLGGIRLVDTAVAQNHFRQVLIKRGLAVEWGKLSLSGADAAFLGEDFAPAGRPTVTDNFVLWSHGDTDPGSIGLWRAVGISIQGETLEWVFFQAVDGRKTSAEYPNGQPYRYLLRCLPEPDLGCAKVVLDLESRTLTLNGPSLTPGSPFIDPRQPPNGANGTLVLDGTLNWP